MTDLYVGPRPPGQEKPVSGLVLVLWLVVVVGLMAMGFIVLWLGGR